MPALDGLRAFAIIGVLLSHGLPVIQTSFPATTPFGKILRLLTEAGPFGVDLFFVLSGLLITGSLLDADKGPGYFKNFYARRVLRLFPVYYLYLVVVGVIMPVIHRRLHTSIPDYGGNWWWYITYFCNWKANFGDADAFVGHFWSLAVEEQFYLVWPTIILLTPRRYLLGVCLALIAGATTLRVVWSAQHVEWNQIYRLTVTRIDTMAWGAIGALLLRSSALLPAAARWARWLAVVGIGGWAAVAAWTGSFSWESPAIQTYGSALAATGFAGLVFTAAVGGDAKFMRFLRIHPLRQLGKYSYTIYVLHLLVLNHFSWLGAFLERRFPTFRLPIELATVVISFGLVYLLAALSWRFLEAPILSLKHRFVSKHVIPTELAPGR